TVQRLFHGHQRLEELPRRSSAERQFLALDPNDDRRVATQRGVAPRSNLAGDPRADARKKSPQLTDTAEFSAAGTASGRRSVPPPVDIEKLTDQVVRQIDQRITAFRERLGKAF